MNWSRSTTFLAALSVAAGLAAPPEARAATPKPIGHSAQVASPVKMDVSPALRTITPIQTVAPGKKAPENPPIPKQGRILGNGAAGADAALQVRPGSTNMPAPIVNFEGVNNIDGVYPPDTQGDVGPNHFIQWVNLHFAIYSKTGATLYGPAAGNTLWTGFGGACETSNDGDPQTNYDHLADRWVMSQFALPNYPSGPYYQCFAVSTTPDPLGTWYRYAFVASATKMNDYPKVGVWPDGYYMTVNQFTGGASWGGLGVFIFERDQMLVGGVAREVYFDTGAVTLNYGGAVPADLDGTPPAPGTPGYVAEWDDSTWGMGDAADTMRIWEVHADWTNPAASTFGLNANYDPNFKITTADVLPLCIGNRNCIPQPGTSVKVDAIGDRLMQRLQYRSIGGVGKLTVNHTVDAGGGRAGVRWYQFTNPGTGWTMADEGTFAGLGGDTDNRWMGAAALDIQGNMAIGYSVSSSTTYPSIRYNGRLAGDPVGTLGTEATLIVGAGSQTGSVGRWGDYSAMLVDPVDECTFWYTQEYLTTTGPAPWQTRIGSFKFPSCVAGPSGTIDGYVKSTAGGGAIPGAHVQIGPSYSTTTNGSGFYTVVVPVGTYDVTASKFGYSPATHTGQVVTDGGTTHVADLMLTPTGSYTVDGFVTAADHNWPLWAKIEVRQAATLITTVYTSPWNGYYEVLLPNGYTYDFTVHSLYVGYQDEVRSVTVASDQVQNFTLLPADGNPAYNCTPPPPVSQWIQNWDGQAAPALPVDWTTAGVSGDPPVWSVVTALTNPAATPHTAANMLKFNSYDAFSGTARMMRSTGDDLSAGIGYLSFWMYHDTGWTTSADSVTAQVSTDSGTTWQSVGAAVNRYDASTGWKQHVIALTGFTGPNTAVRVGLLGTTQYGNNIGVDEVELLIGPPRLCTAVAGSLVAGFVTDANTAAGLVGAQVARDLGGVAFTMAATGNLPAGFYYMFSASVVPVAPNGPSTRTFTASKSGYGSVAHSINPTPDTVNRLDFALPAGSLSLAGWPFDIRGRLTPDGLPLWDKTHTFSILNSGGLPANVKLNAVLLGPGWIPPLPMQPVGPWVLAPQYVAKNLFSLKGVPQLPRPAKPTPPRLAAGDVLTSWATGLALPWGAGVTGANPWASNPSVGGGDDFDYEFSATGTPTGRKVQAVFGGSWAADMTRADGNGMLWQVNVGGDNCIYEIDPNLGKTNNKICPAFATSQRGLAYDPDSDTFFAGNWTDTTIYRFNRAGVIGQQINSGISVAGLAYNPATQHLFVMENSPTDTVTVLDVANGYSVVGTFTIAGFGNYSGAGIEFGCDGLWAMNQNDGKAYLVDAGESYPCNPNLPWFTMTPTQGVVPPHSQLDILTEFFPEGVPPANFGLFRAAIHSTNDTPDVLPTIPVFFTKAFWDVPRGYWADGFIHGLAGARITHGCGAGNYCPEISLTRAQMAILLIRSAHGPDFVPPPAVGIFADVVISDTDTTADFIEQLYNDGYTVGCATSPLRFCPNDILPREQMAVFLERLKHGPSYVPPPAVGIFGDVPISSTFAPWIEQLYADGITVGCSTAPLLFCPSETVTRAQIAVFLVRVLDLPYIH